MSLVSRTGRRGQDLPNSRSVVVMAVFATAVAIAVVVIIVAVVVAVFVLVWLLGTNAFLLRVTVPTQVDVLREMRAFLAEMGGASSLDFLLLPRPKRPERAAVQLSNSPKLPRRSSEKREPRLGVLRWIGYWQK